MNLEFGIRNAWGVCPNSYFPVPNSRFLIVPYFLHASALDTVLRHAERATPRECCGVLVGREGEILQAVEARNLAEDPNRYLLDPQDHIAILRRVRAAGLAVLGFYHSHPHSAARPSETDQAEASYPGHLYLIVGRGEEVRLFRLIGGNFVETPFVTVT
jgi:proteasome lid subunit RPN8/RPN11